MSNTQAGGHTDGFIFRNNLVLKRATSKAGQSEKSFYLQIFQNGEDHPLIHELKHYIPGFHGVEVVENNEYLTLDNQLHSFTFPSLMDAKIGEITWGPDQSASKIAEQRMRSNGSTSSTLGFRLCGAILKESDGTLREKWTRKEKFFSITKENIHIEFQNFITRDGVMNLQAAQELRRQTQQIYDWFDRQRLFKFYAASVLYVNGTVGDQVQCRAAMIDFAHVFDAQGEKDENSMRGLTGLLQVWDYILVSNAEVNQ